MATAKVQPTDPAQEQQEASVVYRRGDEAPVRAEPEPPGTGGGRGLAPTVTPLIIGFTLLLIVISVLGFLSIRRMDEVGTQVLDLEQQQLARISLLLQLRLALTRLNNEARSRQDAEAGKGLRPPFDMPLGNARETVSNLLPSLERPPLSRDPKWNRFRADLEAYVQVTGDRRRYSLEGFERFRTADTELNELLAESESQQKEIFQTTQAIQQRAARSIRVWSLIALLVGILVAAGTIWEVQRRFRQMRRSMDEARRERSFSNQMLQGMVSAVVAVDEQDRIRSANKAFFDIFPGASIGAFVREKFAPDDAIKMLEVAISTRASESVYRGRWVCNLNGAGSEKSFDVYSSPLAIDADRGLLVTLVDVTEAAQAERENRRNEALAAVGQATTQVAHEIKNPLGSIRLGVSMLRDNVSGDKDALRTLELVERGIKHLNKLVIDVTEFSRHKPLHRSTVELGDLIDKGLELVSDRIHEKGTVVERIVGEEKLRGSWDSDQLLQVFVNLIANAIDASPQRTPISIATERVGVLDPAAASAPERPPVAGEPARSSLSYARVVISDQGSGMDKATFDRIFEPFFSTKRRGTGLGLAIVKQIIDQHEGKISVESEPGKGTRFTIDLPL